MQLTIADLLQLITTVIALIAIALVIRKQPSEIKATEAVTNASKANTAGEYIDNQNKLLGMFTAESLSKVELLNKFAALNLRVIEVEGKNAELKMEVSAVTKRAELGERSAQDYKKLYEEILIQVEALQQQVRDYPQTVLDLQEEVRRLRQLASQNAAARVTEAETASTLANTAAQASSTPLASKVEGKE